MIKTQELTVGKPRYLCPPTFGQRDDTGDDDEDQSKHFNESQGDLSARGHGHTPAVDCYDKRCRERDNE